MAAGIRVVLLTTGQEHPLPSKFAEPAPRDVRQLRGGMWVCNTALRVVTAHGRHAESLAQPGERLEGGAHLEQVPGVVRGLPEHQVSRVKENDLQLPREDELLDRQQVACAAQRRQLEAEECIAEVVERIALRKRDS